jgi:CRP-like cAMP-binding protein
MDRINVAHAKQRLAQHEQARSQRRARLQGEEARYTLILHHARKTLDITIHEYCLADTVHKLSSNRSTVPGWCYASKDHLASTLGLTRRSIHNIINKLKARDILEVQEGTGYLRTTEAWREAVEVLKDMIFGQ